MLCKIGPDACEMRLILVVIDGVGLRHANDHTFDHVLFLDEAELYAFPGGEIDQGLVTGVP